MRKNEYQVYSELLTFDWNAVLKATQIITSYATSMESDEMKIEFLFIKLFETIEKLKEQIAKIADDLLAEFKKVFDQNINLLVPFSAFLLTCEGSKFWQNCPKAYQYYFISKGWCGIVFYCKKSNILLDFETYQCFTNHLLTSSQISMDPFNFLVLKNNKLGSIALRILSIPCSETPVERLFGGLTFMIDESSTRMKDDLINAELTIRMSTIFQNQHNFDGNMLQKLEKSFNIFKNMHFLKYLNL